MTTVQVTPLVRRGKPNSYLVYLHGRGDSSVQVDSTGYRRLCGIVPSLSNVTKPTTFILNGKDATAIEEWYNAIPKEPHSQRLRKLVNM